MFDKVVCCFEWRQLVVCRSLSIVAILVFLYNCISFVFVSSPSIREPLHEIVLFNFVFVCCWWFKRVGSIVVNLPGTRSHIHMERIENQTPCPRSPLSPLTYILALVNPLHHLPYYPTVSGSIPPDFKSSNDSRTFFPSSSLIFC